MRNVCQIFGAGFLLAVLLLSTLKGFTPYMFIATLNYFLLLAGVSIAKVNRNIHARCMSTAIASDILLVLILQVKRDAIQTAISFKLTALNQLHIACSSVATLLYFFVFYLGYKLLSGQFKPAEHAKKRLLHRRIGIVTLVFRSLGFLLMFSMIKNHS